MFEEMDFFLPEDDLLSAEEDLLLENFADPEQLALEQQASEAELALSQAQGNWLDGYLDAIEEWEDEEDD